MSISGDYFATFDGHSVTIEVRDNGDGTVEVGVVAPPGARHLATHEIIDSPVLIEALAYWLTRAEVKA